MHMKLVFNDDTGGGSYTASASNGTINGTVLVTSYTKTKAKGIPIYHFVGYGTVSGGTGLYQHSTTSQLTMAGEVLTNEARFNMKLTGSLYY